MTCLTALILLVGVALEVSARSLRVSRNVGGPRDPDIHYGFGLHRDRCTALGAGKKAMADGSTVTTHNNDCQECDYRITHVPRMEWPEGSMRAIHPIRTYYPRYAEEPGQNLHGPDYLLDKVDTTIYNWTATPAVGFIPQVRKTYAYTLGTYAIQNEKQVSIGESTCAAVFYAAPVHDGGKALLHMETLTELALERCDTARCAVSTMGALAVQYGFYGGDYARGGDGAQDEAGEALVVADPEETWMFHVLPDDTASSAIWVAQRIPDEHIAVVANQFVIQTFDLSDSANFLGSANIYEVAQRAKLWDPASGPLNFARVFAPSRHGMSDGCTRRVWRVMTLAAPSLLPIFSPYTDPYATFGFGADGSQPYPFSVKPDQPLSVQDVMNMNRDQYEGTLFDLSAGLDAGPFGDTTRFPGTSLSSDPVLGMSSADYNSGLDYQRAISLWRTAYSTVTQSRSSLPDVVGGVTWIAQYAPHHSSFVPVYANAASAPSPLNVGSQFKLDKASLWWVHCLTGNYLSRWYRFTIGDVRDFQRRIEATLFSAQQDMERQVAAALQAGGKLADAASTLLKFQEDTAQSVLNQWWDFFFHMAGTYRDMYKIVDMHVENFNDAYKYLTTNRDWMESVGYWGAPGTPPPGREAVPVRPINVPTEETKEDYARLYPHGYFVPYTQASLYQSPASSPASAPAPASAADNGFTVRKPLTTSTSGFALLMAAMVGVTLGVFCTLCYVRSSSRFGYKQIA